MQRAELIMRWPSSIIGKQHCSLETGSVMLPHHGMIRTNNMIMLSNSIDQNSSSLPCYLEYKNNHQQLDHKWFFNILHYDFFIRPHLLYCWELLFNQVFNKNRIIVMLKSAAGGHAGGWVGWRQSFGFRSITLVCFGLLTPNLLYG